MGSAGGRTVHRRVSRRPPASTHTPAQPLRHRGPSTAPPAPAEEWQQHRVGQREADLLNRGRVRPTPRPVGRRRASSANNAATSLGVLIETSGPPMPKIATASEEGHTPGRQAAEQHRGGDRQTAEQHRPAQTEPLDHRTTRHRGERRRSAPRHRGSTPSPTGSGPRSALISSTIGGISPMARPNAK